MTAHDRVELVVSAVIIVAALGKLLQLRRASPGVNRPAVAAMCLAILAIGAAAIQESYVVVAALDRVLGVNLAYAQRHTPALISFTAVRVAFLCWVWPPGPRRRRRLTVHVGLLVAVLALRWLLALAASPADAAAGLTGDWTHAPWTAIAVLLYIVYAALTLGSVTAMALTWAREIASTRRWTATGLRLVAAGGFGFGFYLTHKAAFLAVELMVGAPPYNPYAVEWPILLVAVLLLVIGLAMPLIATGLPAAVYLARQRAAYGRLRPLWLALTTQRPEVVMSCRPEWVPARLATVWDFLDVQELSFRLYRRVIECWDVMAGLHGHLDAELRASVLEQARHEVDESTAEAVAAAVMIRVALQRAQDGEAVTTEGSRADSPDHYRELSRNVSWWQRVAHAWGHPLTARLSPPLSVA